MSKNDNKTKATRASVQKYLDGLSDERRADCEKLIEIMSKVTGCPPVIWGKSIVGFDTYHYKYPSGREGDFLATGFSSRQAALTLYIMPGYQDYTDLMEKLGPHKHGKSCLYIKRLSDIHMPTLKKIITKGYKDLKKIAKEMNA